MADAFPTCARCGRPIFFLQRCYGAPRFRGDGNVCYVAKEA